MEKLLTSFRGLVAVPDLNYIIRQPHRNSDSIDLIAFLEMRLKLVANRGKNKITPDGLGVGLEETKNPNTASNIEGVLPVGL